MYLDVDESSSIFVMTGLLSEEQCRARDARRKSRSSVSSKNTDDDGQNNSPSSETNNNNSSDKNKSSKGGSSKGKHPIKSCKCPCVRGQVTTNWLPEYGTQPLFYINTRVLWSDIK